MTPLFVTSQDPMSRNSDLEFGLEIKKKNGHYLYKKDVGVYTFN